MSLTIAVDGRPALYSKTGIGVLCYEFIKRIRDIDSQNRYLFYFDREPRGLARELGAENCRWMRITNRLAWANTFAALQAKRDHVDIYVSFLEKDIPLFSFSPKIILWVCDVIPLRLDFTFRNKLHRLYYNVLLRRAVARSAIVCTISQTSKRDIEELLDVQPSKVKVVTVGGQSEQRAKKSSAILVKYRIRPPYILAIGSTEPRKNNVCVIHAFNHIATTYPSLMLVIVGKRWRGRHFPVGILNRRIIETGYVPDEDMPALYASAELLVFPSLYEGFGLPVLEAMASGTPVVTSSTSSLPEVAGDAALYVDPIDIQDISEKMLLLLGDQARCDELIERGRRRAALFRWDAMCNDVIKLYQALRGESRPN